MLGLFLLRWPAPWSLPAAIAILAALALVAVADARKGAVRTPELAWALAIGCLRALATIAAAALAAVAIVHAIELVRRESEPWAGSPLPFEIALVAGACLAALLVARIPLLARASTLASWSGFWIAFAGVGVASAAKVTGASYLFLVPCAVAAVSRLARNAFAFTAIPACALALLWAPLAIGLEDAVELRAPVALALPIGCMLAAANPVCTASSCRWLALVLVLATGWAIAAPASTVDRPAWVTFSHLEGPEDGAARLFAMTQSSSLPEELRPLAAFSTTPERAFPELPWLPSGFAAPVAGAPADAARIEVLETRREADARLVDVRISSPRGAPCLLLHLSGLASVHADSGVVSVRIGGAPVHGSSWPGADHGGLAESSRVFFGVPAEGIALTLRTPLDGQAELLVLDIAYGLPPSDAKIARARPADCVARGQGDQWVVARRARL